MHGDKDLPDIRCSNTVLSVDNVRRVCNDIVMPDNDIVPRSTRRAWKPAAELVIGGHPAELVADECGRALAAELREADCGRGIIELAERLDDAILLARPDLYAVAAAAFLQSSGETPIAAAVVAEGERLIEVPTASCRSTAESLLEGALLRLSEGALFGSKAMVTRMHQMAGMTLEGLDLYTRNILDSVPVESLAASVIRSPETSTRAPARRSVATTADMLGEQI